MKKIKRVRTLLIILVLIGAGIGSYVLLQPAPQVVLPYRSNSSPTTPKLSFSYQDYAVILKTYVDRQGLVNYKKLKSHSELLDAFISSLGVLKPKIYTGWNKEEKLTFWINAYNALTLEAILTHYPIHSSFFRSLRFPKKSIRQIPGVWDKLKFTVMDQPTTLNDIENHVLRRQFHEPRIHMAIVCASIGCPPLRNEPYMASRLDSQLDDQVRRFLSNPQKFTIHRDQEVVFLSPIFDWFGNDFVKRYGTDQRYRGHSAVERAVLNFISRYVSEQDKQYLETAHFKINYLDYDWSLNEQKQ